MTLSELAKKIEAAGIDALLVARNNRFLKQDTLDAENIVRELSGFDGSAGTLLVFPQKTLLFVDGRYTLQAKKQTKNIEIIEGTPEKWLAGREGKPLKIGCNPWCHTIKEVEKLSRHAKLVETELLPDRISPKPVAVFDYPVEFAGLSCQQKIVLAAKKIKDAGADAYLATAADSASWLANLRSDALPHSPVIRAYALIGADGTAELFSGNMDKLEKRLKRLKGKKLCFCYYQTPQKILSLADKIGIRHESLIDPCQALKSVKNPAEIANIRKAHIADGIALCALLSQVKAGQSELDIVRKLRQLRQTRENFFSDSFDTIAAFGANAAVVHYRPTAKTDKKLETGGLFLLDSGAQYLTGTTDATRTVAIGKPTREMKAAFTRVLKAHIALASAAFPKDTPGQRLDILARAQLWPHGMDYAHGTGHGVGCFLNVHEGPNAISPHGAQYPLAAGMVTSIEPGYYKENAFGIRIENLYLIKEKKEKNGGFLEFEPLTLAPVDRRLIDKKLLAPNEIRWLDAYHARVLKKLSPHIPPLCKGRSGEVPSASLRRWLAKSCAKL